MVRFTVFQRKSPVQNQTGLPFCVAALGSGSKTQCSFSLCRWCGLADDPPKQSILSSRQDGLLRGACHRARIRATRWLAMTLLWLFENVEVGVCAKRTFPCSAKPTRHHRA
jgi:hypothetical protein